MKHTIKKRIEKNPVFAAGFRSGVREFFDVLEPLLDDDTKKALNKIKRNITAEVFKAVASAEKNDMKNMIEFEAELLFENQTAAKFEIGFDEPIWFPKEAIAINPHPSGKPALFVIHVPEKLAFDKGLI